MGLSISVVSAVGHGGGGRGVSVLGNLAVAVSCETSSGGVWVGVRLGASPGATSLSFDGGHPGLGMLASTGLAVYGVFVSLCWCQGG